MYWRNAGKWRLTANHPQARFARQAVRTWKETAVPFVQNTVEQSRQVLVLDAQIQATAAQQAQALARQSQVDNLSRVLQDWANSLETITTCVTPSARRNTRKSRRCWLGRPPVCLSPI